MEHRGISSQLWVQVHNLPIEYISKENAQNIGALLGKVLEVDFSGDGLVCMSRFLRVKVEFEVSKSLKSGFFLDRDPLLDIWIQLKYERVIDFCFKCGRLGHVKVKCSSQLQKMLNEPQGFGPWMKVEIQGKRTSRWVGFLSEICNEDEDSNNPEPSRSPPSTMADDVKRVMNNDETGKHINSFESLGTLTA